jgi:DedD protein
VAASRGNQRVALSYLDRRVKERLIGASILVALIVLVVPELLSGPRAAAPSAQRAAAISAEPIRNVTVDLATSKPPADAESAPAAAQPAASAASAAATPAPDAAPAAAETPAPVETAAFSPTSAAQGSWAVQLGSFASRVNADNLAHQLKAQGMPVYVLPGGIGQAARYRVRVGPFADRQAAEKAAAKLKSMGHVSNIVAPAA